MTYAGIGARNTPVAVLAKMRKTASALEKRGWKLRSGGAAGADSAFEGGCSNKDIYRPLGKGPIQLSHPEYISLEGIASKHHNGWHSLSSFVKYLMVRNAAIIMGARSKYIADVVICYTDKGRVIGGTGHTIRIARSLFVPVINFGSPVFQEQAANELILSLENGS